MPQNSRASSPDPLTTPPELARRTERSGLPSEIRWKALRALRRLGPDAVPLLTQALHEEADPAVRRFAADALATFQAHDVTAGRRPD